MSFSINQKTEIAHFQGGDIQSFRFAIVVSQYHSKITHLLRDSCQIALKEAGVKVENIEIFEAPGAFELVAAASLISGSKAFDAIICLGCVIQGETDHHDYINHAVANGLINLSLVKQKPFIFGLLTTKNEDQALQRANGTHGNKGVEAAEAGLKMVVLKQSLNKKENQIGF